MEEWRDIIGYEGVYEVSSYGNVRSLYREVYHDGRIIILKGKQLSLILNKSYLYIGLNRYGIKTKKSVHRLVAEAFLVEPVSTERIVVDHIDNNGHNNKLSNLRYITQRANASRRYNISGYVGVYPSRDKWVAQIYMEGKKVCLGSYVTPEEASNAYQKELAKFNKKQADNFLKIIKT